MRVREVRISGFRAVPVGVEVHWPHGQRGRTAQMQWAKDAFCVTLPTAARRSELRGQLLRYCAHDTLAMVRVLHFFA